MLNNLKYKYLRLKDKIHWWYLKNEVNIVIASMFMVVILMIKLLENSAG
jgi:hypothetical protein